jgi:hypothetical protein
MRRKHGGDGLRDEMASDLGNVLHMLGMAKRLSQEAGGPLPHITAGLATTRRRLAMIESGAAFYCPAARLPLEARDRFDPGELVEVGEDGRVRPYDGPVVKRKTHSSAEPPRPRMTAAGAS